MSKINIFVEKWLFIFFCDIKTDTGFFLIQDFREQKIDIILIETTLRVDIVCNIKFVTLRSCYEIEFQKNEFDVFHF